MSQRSVLVNKFTCKCADLHRQSLSTSRKCASEGWGWKRTEDIPSLPLEGARGWSCWQLHYLALNIQPRQWDVLQMCLLVRKG